MPRPRKQKISLDATPYYHSALASCVALRAAVVHLSLCTQSLSLWTGFVTGQGLRASPAMG